MMKNTCILFLLLCFMQNVQSQTKTFGIEGALSSNFISFSSTNELQQELGIKKGIGANLGANMTFTFTNFSIRNKLGFQFNRFKYLPEFYFTDINGHSIGEVDKSVRNLSTLLTSAITFNTESGFYVGTGVSLSYLINSHVNTFWMYVEGQETEGWIRNYQYRDVGIYIPIIMGVEWRKNAIFMNYFWGMTDKNLQSFSINEREKLINLGYRYTFSK